MKKIIAITFFFISLTTFPSKALDITPGLRTLLKIEKKFQEIKTLKGTFIKTVNKDDEAFEIHCKFYYKAPDKILFSFLKPVEKEIASNGKILKFKENDKLTNKNISSLSPEEKLNYGIIPGFGIDYLAPIKVELYDFEIKDEKDGVTIISALPKKENLPKLIFHVDTKINNLQKITYIFEKEAMMNTIDFADYKEIDKNNWFATKITSITTKEQKQYQKEEIIYNSMRFNIELEDALFN